MQGILVFAALFLAIFLSKSIFSHWKNESLDESLDAAGLALVLFGFLFRIAARGYKEEETNSGHRLVETGPYAIVRNPMYFGTLVIGTGIILVFLKLWLILVFALIFLFIYAPQIKKEESILSDKFKQQYSDYRKKTPKYFPSIKSLFNIRNYVPIKASWVKKEIMSLISVFTVIFIIEIMEDATPFGLKEIIEESKGLFLIILLFVLVIFLFSKKKLSTRI